MRQCVLCWRIKWGVVKDRESSNFFCFKRECVVFGGLWVGSLGVRGVFTISPLCLRKNEGENFSEEGVRAAQAVVGQMGQESRIGDLTYNSSFRLGTFKKHSYLCPKFNNNYKTINNEKTFVSRSPWMGFLSAT